METKTCCYCNEVKPLSDFNKNKRMKDGYQSRCKMCHGIHNKKHYKENRNLYRRRASDNKRRLYEWFIEITEGLSCSKCGEDRRWCLDFHHPNPNEKEDNVSVLVANAHSKERILAEMDKCVALCKNCHADVHYQMKNGPLV